MLVDWIYNVPTWEMASVACAVIVGVSLIGLVITSRLIPVEFRRKHNEFAGFNSALVGVVFAVLLAFVAVAAWGTFDKAADTAEMEASLAGDLFRDSFTMPDPIKADLAGDMRDYVDVVLNQEWPAMAKGAHFGDDGWAPLYRFQQRLTRVQTSDLIQAAVVSEALRRLNSLYDARRERILAARDHIAPMVWRVVLIGAGLTILFTYLFGMESFTMHLVMTGAVAIALALVIVLIVAFDYPFRGQVQVTPEGFQNVRQSMEMAGLTFGHAAP
ncbi:MAG TPA: hypothetical protein VGL83_13845 [Stellaceae bacterium]|jgi:hypothetical protein